MRTKTIYFFSLFLTITMMTGCFHISSGPKPSKSKMTKKYSVTPFNKIENKAPANIYNPQIQISAESETKRSIFREKDKTKRSKKESAQHSKSRNKSFVMTSVSAL